MSLTVERDPFSPPSAGLRMRLCKGGLFATRVGSVSSWVPRREWGVSPFSVISHLFIAADCWERDGSIIVMGAAAWLVPTMMQRVGAELRRDPMPHASPMQCFL